MNLRGQKQQLPLVDLHHHIHKQIIMSFLTLIMTLTYTHIGLTAILDQTCGKQSTNWNVRAHNLSSNQDLMAGS